MDDPARRIERAQRADLDLRSPSGIVDAGPWGRVADLRRTGHQASRIREAYGLLAYRIAAHPGISVFRLVGLSGHRVLQQLAPRAPHPRFQMDFVDRDRLSEHV